MLSWVVNLFGAYRIYFIAAGAVFLLFAGWKAHKLVIDAESADRLKSAINTRIAAEQFGFKQAMDLETGLNAYRKTARQLDKEVQNATDATKRFDAGGVQRTTARIAAGKAARQRSH